MIPPPPPPLRLNDVCTWAARGLAFSVCVYIPGLLRKPVSVKKKRLIITVKGGPSIDKWGNDAKLASSRCTT